MRRKIQKTGGSTYIISLPKEWVEQEGIKERDEVALYPSKDKIIIRKEEKERAKVIDASNSNLEMVKRKIIGAYIQGENRILIRNIKGWEKKARIVRFVQDYLIGMDVVSEEEDVLVQVIIDPEAITLDKSMDRLIELVKWMLSAIEDFLISNSSREKGESIIMRDKEVDKQNTFVKRLCIANIKTPLSKTSEEEEHKHIITLSLANILENIADIIVERVKKEIRSSQQHSNTDNTGSKDSIGGIGGTDNTYNNIYNMNNNKNNISKLQKEIEIIRYEKRVLEAIYEAYKNKNISTLSKIADEIKSRLKKLRDEPRHQTEVGERIINILHLEKDLAEDMIDVLC